MPSLKSQHKPKTQPSGSSREASEPASASIQAELQELRQLLAAQANQIRELKQQLNQTAKAQVAATTLSTGVPSSRRKMLKRLGLVAAGLSAASAASLLSPDPKAAQAASGDVLLVGNSNLASTSTYLSQTNSTTSLDKGAVLVVDFNSSGASPTPTVNAAVAGVAADSSYGAVGGYFQGSRANVLLAAGGTTGVPTGSHSTGELYVDSAGTLWYCVEGSTNSWRILASKNPLSGSITLLPSPIRIVGPNNPQYSQFPTLTGGGTLYYYKMEGSWTNTTPSPGISATIPSSAIGVIGVITAWNSTAAGLIIVHPADVSTPGTVTLEYQANGTFAANEFTCRLGAIPSGVDAGKKGIAIMVGSTCNLALDVVGYID